MKRPELTKFEEEALEELARIEIGASSLFASEPWGDHVLNHFLSSNGWQFCVFEDGGEFDYFKWISDPNGRTWYFVDGWSDTSQDESEVLSDWRPGNERVWYLAANK